VTEFCFIPCHLLNDQEMSDNFATPPGPFTIHRKANGFEVLLIIAGQFAETPSCLCSTEEEAKALANSRDFNHRYEYPQSYNEKEKPLIAEVEKTIEALAKHGFGNAVVFRHCQRFADQLRNKN
jgi:hypothetical protein